MPSTPKDSGGGMRSIRRVTLTGRHEGPSRQSDGSESGTRERAPRSIPASGYFFRKNLISMKTSMAIHATTAPAKASVGTTQSAGK